MYYKTLKLPPTGVVIRCYNAVQRKFGLNAGIRTEQISACCIGKISQTTLCWGSSILLSTLNLPLSLRTLLHTHLFKQADARLLICDRTTIWRKIVLTWSKCSGQRNTTLPDNGWCRKWWISMMDIRQGYFKLGHGANAITKTILSWRIRQEHVRLTSEAKGIDLFASIQHSTEF